MARSPGTAVFDREVSELRLLNALTGNYSAWVEVAVREALTAEPEALTAILADRYRELVIEPTMQSAVVEGFQGKASEYLSRYSPMDDASDVITAVRDYATEKGLTKRATRNLLRDSLSPDARVLERIPPELMTVGKGAPRLAHRGFPFAERGLSYRDRLTTTARTLSTGMDGWAARKQAAVTGDELRWVTMQDSKVRMAHRHAQGQTVAYDEPFSVGTFPMWFPGDPDAPEDLTVNCRCVLAAIPATNRRVQRYIPSEWLTASAATQARAPKGAPGGIGGEWIDTPTAMLRSLNRLTVGNDVVNGPRGVLGVDAVDKLRREAAEGILAREGRPGLQETADRVKDIYSRTTPEQREAGARWYDDAREVARGMVADSNGTMTEEQAVAVLAHLSTRTTWAMNVAAAQALARGESFEQANATLKAMGEAGTLPKGAFILARNWEKAQVASTSADPIGRDNQSLGTFSEKSNKTRTFASNMMGDQDGVTIDTWMYRTLGQSDVVAGTVPGNPLRLREDQVYESLAESVRVAASDLGVPPVEVQATTWLWTLNNYHPFRAGRPGYILDAATGEEIPALIGGDLVTAAADEVTHMDDGEVLDYFYVQAAKVGVTPPMPEFVSPDEHRAEWIDALLASGFAPSQARIPKGQEGGGRWTVTATGVRDFLSMAKEFQTVGKPFDPTADYIVTEPVPEDMDIGLQAETMFATNRLGEDPVHDAVNGYLRGGGEPDTDIRDGGGISAVDQNTGEERVQEQSYFDSDDDIARLLTIPTPLTDEMIPSMVQAIDAGMENNYTTEPTMLYRGIAAEFDNGSEWEVGTRFIERGYTSASATEEMAANFALFRSGQPSAFDDAVADGTEVIRDQERSGTPTLMEISLAPGTNFAYGAEMVHEVLLERKMIYEVTGVKTEVTPIGLGDTVEMQTVSVAAYPLSTMKWEPEVDPAYVQQTLFDTPEEVEAA